MARKEDQKAKMMIERLVRFIYPIRDRAWRRKRGCWGGKNINIPIPGEKVIPPQTPSPQTSGRRVKEAEE